MLPVISRHTYLIFLCLLPALAFSQPLPAIPTEVSFGGETIFLNAQAQRRLQEEMAGLYADRSVLRNTIDQLHYVGSLVRPMLKERSIPADIQYACLPTGTSNGAYWELDTRKASRLNLRVDSSIDERLNLVTSSEAVLGELAAWHTKYPNWNWIRVLMNYAAGQRPSDPPSAIQPGGARLPNDLLQLPDDSPALLWVALARKVAFEHESRFSPPGSASLFLYDYRQGRGKTLAAISRELGIEQDRFVPFNEWLKVQVIPTDKVYPVLIRLTASELITVRNQVNSTVLLGPPSTPPAQQDIGFPILRKIPVPAALTDPVTRISVQFYDINDRKGVQAQSCDNVITMAYYGQLSIKSFMEINDMNDRDLVRPGEIYYLERKARKAKIPFHVMQVGQTLREVSTIYGIQMKYLLKYNHLTANQRLLPGRILWLREKRPTNVPPEYQPLPAPVFQPEPTVVQPVVIPQSQTAVASDVPPITQRFPVDSTNGLSATNPNPTNAAPLINRPEQGTLVTEQASSQPPSQPSGEIVYYTVREGDTHSGVAQRYRITLTDLLAWNNLPFRQPLVVGQRLVVGKPLPPAPATTARTSPARSAPPVTTPSSPAPATPAVNPARSEPPKARTTSYYHTVQPGQTVYRIALINKVSIQDLMRWNGLTNYTIEAGQRILIKK